VTAPTSPLPFTDAQLAHALKHPEVWLRELDRVDSEQSLYGFIKCMWPILEPQEPFVGGWVLRAICEHLEAVTRGEILRLLINVSPGSTKSLATDVFWPAWEWGPKRLAHLRYVCASYSGALTVRDNMRFQRLVEHQRYRDLWGKVWKQDERQWEKIKCANDKTGWKIATSVGGIGTGERGNRFIIDDPNSVQEAESDTIRATANTWFREVVPDRLNNLNRDAIVLIQQRTHGDDVSNVAIELGYTHLMIPMEHDASRHCVTVLGWEDPRTEDGELAWPERFSAEKVAELKTAKGPYAYAAQYDQLPAPRGGGILKRDWWQMWPPEGPDEVRWFRAMKDENGKQLVDEEGYPKFAIKYPPMEYIVGSLDTAFKLKEENDYSAMTVWGVFMFEEIPGVMVPKLLLMEAWKDRLPFNELVERVMRTCRPRPGGRDGVDALLIEDKASGQSVVQEIQRIMSSPRWVSEQAEATTWTTVPINPDGDKGARVHSIVPLFTNKMIFAPAENQFRKWAEEVISECAIFPRGQHDDYVDSTSMALRYLRKINLAQLASERQADDMAAMSLDRVGMRDLPQFGDDVGGF